MKTAFCFQHVLFEGPGIFRHCLEKRGFKVQEFLVPSEKLPANIPDLLLIMGGPMSVNDPDPWIAQELEYIRLAIELAIPVLGIFLGSQFIAKALGGEVRP